MASSSIRDAGTADASALASLAGRLGYPCGAAEMARRMHALKSDERQAVFVAEDDAGRVVGWAQVCGVHRLLSAPFAELSALVVDETQRGRGLGKALTSRALQWTGANGYLLLRVRTNIVREGTHRFYETLGFQREKTQHVFIKTIAPSAGADVAGKGRA